MSNIDRVVIKTTNSSKILLISQKIRPNFFHSSDNFRHFCPEIFIQFLLWGLFFTFSSLISRAGFSGQATAQQRGRRQQKLKQLSPSLPPSSTVSTAAAVLSHTAQFFLCWCVFLTPGRDFYPTPSKIRPDTAKTLAVKGGPALLRTPVLRGKAPSKKSIFAKSSPSTKLQPGSTFWHLFDPANPWRID